MTSDAGALLLGATDRAIRLVDRFAACFTDGRNAGLIEHEVRTLVGQRVFGIGLGYEDPLRRLAAKLRHANIDGAAGAMGHFARICSTMRRRRRVIGKAEWSEARLSAVIA